jgi:membrane protein YqaA with SNARE-associated domain
MNYVIMVVWFELGAGAWWLFSKCDKNPGFRNSDFVFLPFCMLGGPVMLLFAFVFYAGYNNLGSTVGWRIK